MEDKKQEAPTPESLLEAWMKASQQFWAPGMKMWPGMTGASPGEDSSAKGPMRRAQESWQATIKTYQTMAAMMQEPGLLDGVAKGINAVPAVLVKMLKPAWDGLFHLQQEWLEKGARIGKSTAAYSFENLEQDSFKAWVEVYEKEFRQFLKVPQLGLTRTYQERLGEAMDKFNIFQATVAEFLSVLYLPMEKSVKVLQEKLAGMAESGKLPDKSKEYYRMWIKILEGHYMTLFKSPEYTHELTKTIDAMGEYLQARQRMLEDMLQFLPVPTQKEMDELYKELYTLKRRIRDLERKQKEDGPQVEE